MATAKLAANILKQNDIPYFLDYKRHVTDNPFIAAINGALGIIENNYSYDSISRIPKNRNERNGARRY